MNLGGGANASGLGSDNITGSVNATYGFTDKRQTNFATIGEGDITVRTSTGSVTGLEGLNRDVSISQYNTKDGGLQGGFTVDADTVNLVVDTVNKIDKLIENPKDTIVADYNKIVAEAKEIYKKVDERNDKIIAGAKELEKQAEIIVEKTGNLVGSGHFTTDDKVQYYLNMDEYEAAKANGGEITVLDTLVYVKSKSAAGEELTGADLSDLRLSSGFVLDGATDAIKENLEANIRINSREEVLASLAVLDMFDADAAADARGYLSGVRDSDARNNEIAVQQNNNSTELVLSVNSSNTGVPGLLEGWGQALSSWGAERNKEAAVLNKDITDSAIVQSGHKYGEYLNANPDVALATCFGAGAVGAGVPILAATSEAWVPAVVAVVKSDKARDAAFGAVTNTLSYVSTSEKVTISGTANAIVTGGVTGLIVSPMTGSAAYNTVTRFIGGAVVGGSADAASQFVKNDMTFNNFNGWQTATNAILTGAGTAFGGVLHGSGNAYMTRSGLANATLIIPTASTNYVVDQLTKD